MILDVFRCSQLFSDVFSQDALYHRYSIEILRCVQDVLRCSQMLTGHTSRSDQAGQTHGRHFSHTIKVTTPAENMGKQLRTSENI